MTLAPCLPWLMGPKGRVYTTQKLPNSNTDCRDMVLFVIDISTRRLQIASIHHAPTEKQKLQWARNLTVRRAK